MNKAETQLVIIRSFECLTICFGEELNSTYIQTTQACINVAELRRNLLLCTLLREVVFGLLYGEY